MANKFLEQIYANKHLTSEALGLALIHISENGIMMTYVRHFLMIFLLK
jgi:hypothetical protein